MTPADNPLDRFPYHCTEETGVPAHLLVRAEGLPLRQALWSGVGYLRKYRDAKWTAAPEEVRHFDAQRQLVRHLASQPAEGPRLAAVGDLMWLRDHWDSFLSPEVLAYLNGHAAVIGNLESPIARSRRVPHLLPDYFTYNSDPRLITSFRRASGASTFSALGTANNHSLDRGDAGLAETLAFLDELGIPHSGVRASADERAWISFEMGGFRVGFYAACWGLNNPDLVRSSRHQIEVVPGLVGGSDAVDLTRLKSVLAQMHHEKIDFRIVALHWGHEFEFYPCPRVMRVAREVVRAGADLLVGTHPHVVQPLEVLLVNGYEHRLRQEAPGLAALEPEGASLLEDETGVPRKALVAYSLGNFATAMYTLHCRIGLILGLTLTRDPATGRTDWHHPEKQLVFNVRRDNAGQRRLMLLDRYLRECERQRRSHHDVRQLAARIARHLIGK